MKVEHKKWTKLVSPKKVLFIRLQAMGDTVITLPYIKGYKNAYPNTTIHFLTRAEVSSIPIKSGVFSKVWVLKGKRNPKLQLIYLLFMLPFLLAQRYEVIYDLQNNVLTSFLRKIIRPKAWCAFNKFFAAPAGQRVKETITSVTDQKKITPDFSFLTHSKKLGEELLLRKGFIKKNQLLIALNPAGAFETRNWSIDNYVSFSILLKSSLKEDLIFIILGDNRIQEKVNFLEDKLNGSVLNFVNKTTPFEAVAILQNVDLMLSEDSGLMHMAWVSGVPTLAIFGSTRSDWSRPLGEHSKLLDSSDLDCGNCLKPKCIFEEVKCLIRYTPEIIKQEAITLLQKCKKIKKE